MHESDTQADSHRSGWTSGILAGLPAVGHFGLSFFIAGAAALQQGFTHVESMAFSGLVYAVPAQLVALSLMATGVGLPTIIGAVFLVNLRFFLMGLSLLGDLERVSARRLVSPFIFIAQTPFIIASTAFKADRRMPPRWRAQYLSGLSVVMLAACVVGASLSGALAGTVPQMVMNRLSFLVSLFLVSKLARGATADQRWSALAAGMACPVAALAGGNAPVVVALLIALVPPALAAARRREVQA